MNSISFSGQLPPEEFNKFYHELINVVFDAQKNQGAAKEMSIRTIMKKHGVELPPEEFAKNGGTSINEEVAPALDANLYQPYVVAADACVACSVCAICAVCGTVNAAAGTLGLAGLITLF